MRRVWHGQCFSSPATDDEPPPRFSVTVPTMGHEAKLTLLADLVDRMSDSCEDWRTADGSVQEQLFAETLRRDMAEFRRVCESLRTDSCRGRSALELHRLAG